MNASVIVRGSRRMIGGAVSSATETLHETASSPIHRPVARPVEALADPPLTIVKPRRGWQLVDPGELWRYRELLYILAWRDVKVRYKQTVLGAAWAVLQPLATMAVFALFLGPVVVGRS